MDELYKQIVWTTKTNDQLDWAAGMAEIGKLTVSDIGDAEDFGDKIYEIEDEGEFLFAVQGKLTDDLVYLKKIWLDFLARDDSYCTLETYGPVHLLETYITDDDQNNSDWTLLNRIPLRVYEKVGFYQ